MQQSIAGGKVKWTPSYRYIRKVKMNHFSPSEFRYWITQDGTGTTKELMVDEEKNRLLLGTAVYSAQALSKNLDTIRELHLGASLKTDPSNDIFPMVDGCESYDTWGDEGFKLKIISKTDKTNMQHREFIVMAGNECYIWSNSYVKIYNCGSIDKGTTIKNVEISAELRAEREQFQLMAAVFKDCNHLVKINEHFFLLDDSNSYYWLDGENKIEQGLDIISKMKSEFARWNPYSSTKIEAESTIDRLPRLVDFMQERYQVRL